MSLADMHKFFGGGLVCHFKKRPIQYREYAFWKCGSPYDAHFSSSSCGCVVRKAQVMRIWSNIGSQCLAILHLLHLSY